MKSPMTTIKGMILNILSRIMDGGIDCKDADIFSIAKITGIDPMLLASLQLGPASTSRRAKRAGTAFLFGDDSKTEDAEVPGFSFAFRIFFYRKARRRAIKLTAPIMATIKL